ncbi:MAG: IS200/IS605 family transposase [Chamaesiphon sp. CSU_1_12]|nr:IS200/IS605 family transposase [Microcoleus sp. SU_5_3]NJR32170.1 IS200/IS605 family transposase [Chamaesiphon sp. CSU_1_12]
MSRVLTSRSHCVYSLNAHLVFVTKYRRKVINAEVLAELKSILIRLLAANDCELVEFGGEPDHVHLLISYPPTVTLSKLINNLKAVSSKLIRKQFKEHVDKFYWKPVFWTAAYCVISTGGAPLDTVKKYIENQNEPEE